MKPEEQRFSKRGPIRGALAAFCLAAVLLVATASPALAVEEKENVTHLFNATLSLTGDCSTSLGDLVEDPGCPGGVHPPEGGFVEPQGVATDPYGDIYVVNRNDSEGAGAFHIDIFDPSGHYIARVAYANARHVAVDSGGHLYVLSHVGIGEELVRFDPTVYNPEAGEIAYGSVPVPIKTGVGPGMAVNPTNDHFYLRVGAFGGEGLHARIIEYGPPTDGVPNEALNKSIGEGVLHQGESPEGQIAVDAVRNRLYSIDWDEGPGGFTDKRTVVRVFNLQSPHQLLDTIDGSTMPGGSFGVDWPRFALAADEASGDIFVGNLLETKKIYVLKADGTYLATIKNPALNGEYSQVAVDDSALSPNQGFVFIPIGFAKGHLYAYEPIFAPKAPVVESISRSGITEEEAVLQATVNPEGEATHYAFEYTTQQDFDESGFANAQLAGEGEIGVSGEGVAVSAPVSGLAPGTGYRFRVRAENQCEAGGCKAEAEAGFTTFAPYAQSGACPNEALRTGASAGLADCRAYELVTPPNTNGRAPEAPVGGAGSVFGTLAASPAGDSVAFIITGGVLPGLEGAGGLKNGDTYVARRGESGWRSQGAGLNGTQTPTQYAGGLSSDHGFAAVDGTLTPGGDFRTYIRYPDGSLHMAGEGSVGVATSLVHVAYISPGGAHILFAMSGSGVNPVQLEPNAPPDGTPAIYDLTPDGTLRVVSLLPGDVTPTAGANYEGSSADGSAVAFRLGGSGPIYLRLDNAQTQVAAPAGSAFAGLSDDGSRMFYVLGGDLYAFDVGSEAVIPFSASGDVTPAYVSADGSSAYFISPSVLGGGANPNGALPVAGANNLYGSREGAIGFVGTVTKADVDGTGHEFDRDTGFDVWLGNLGSGALGALPARTTPGGSVLLFESGADLSGFQSAGKKQIYRYDAEAGTLGCLSCDSTGGRPTSDATMITESLDSPGWSLSLIPNLSSDGRRAFFESAERLVPADENGLTDVYEWEAQGKGSCAQPGGCLFLISSGKSARPNYLFGASESGDDVFIYTSDLLSGEDAEETASIYDVRVDGGLPPRAAGAGECQGEACQPAAVAPNDPTPASSSFEGSGNVKSEGEAKARCPKGKKAARKGGKSRCVPRHHKKQQHKRAKSNGRAHR